MEALLLFAPVSAFIDLAKPLQGSPCNGCGLCCQLEVCSIGKTILGEDAPTPCPMLIYRDGRTWCGAIILEEGNFPLENRLLWQSLGIGKGCCTSDQPELLEEIAA